jgi:hypothetical protein
VIRCIYLFIVRHVVASGVGIDRKPFQITRSRQVSFHGIYCTTHEVGSPLWYHTFTLSVDSVVASFYPCPKSRQVLACSYLVSSSSFRWELVKSWWLYIYVVHLCGPPVVLYPCGTGFILCFAFHSHVLAQSVLTFLRSELTDLRLCDSVVVHISHPPSSARLWCFFLPAMSSDPPIHCGGPTCIMS